MRISMNNESIVWHHEGRIYTKQTIDCVDVRVIECLTDYLDHPLHYGSNCDFFLHMNIYVMYFLTFGYHKQRGNFSRFFK